MNHDIFELFDVTNKAIFVFNAVSRFELISRPPMHSGRNLSNDVTHFIVGPHFLKFATQVIRIPDSYRIYASRALGHFCKIGVVRR